jgi:DNA-binding NarL/FixJ family response regulator
MSASPKNQIRVLLVDDHAVVRAGLRLLIDAQPDMNVVGEAANGLEALNLASLERPDIILLDVALAGENGLDFLPELRLASPNSRVVILTGVRDLTVHRRAVHLGAMGLVFKDRAADVLIKAVQKVHAGEVWLDRALTATVLTELSQANDKKAADEDSKKIASLTEREREILALVCQGLKNKQVADALFISEATVRNHLTSILGKLQLSDRFQLALFAYRHHLAKPPG